MFSIVTPSLNQLDFLKRASASIQDQGIEVEHLVQDGGSSPEVIDWLNRQQNLISFVETDSGVYDAINRGFERAQGKYFGWLNCDEQYLPGTLDKVAEAWERFPDVDILYGNSLVIHPDGKLLSFRKTANFESAQWYPPPFQILSCSLFFKRTLWDRGLHLDSKYKCVADLDWFLRALESGVKIKHITDYLGVYTFTGSNLSHKQTSLDEVEEWARQHPQTSGFRGLSNKLLRWISKWRNGCYSSSPIEYQIFTQNLEKGRVTFLENNPSSSWPEALV